MKPLGKAVAVFDRVLDVCIGIAGVMLIFDMLSVSGVVGTRYAFDFIPRGFFEIWEYTILYMTFLGAAWLLRREGHVNIDLLVARLKPKAQNILNFITSSICTLASLALAWFGVQMTLTSARQGLTMANKDLNPPEWIILMVVPFGGALLFLQFMRRTYRLYKGLAPKVSPEEKATIE